MYWSKLANIIRTTGITCHNAELRIKLLILITFNFQLFITYEYGQKMSVITKY